MDVEHKRPLFAFLVVTVVAGYVLGDAVQKQVAEVVRNRSSTVVAGTHLRSEPGYVVEKGARIAEDEPVAAADASSVRASTPPVAPPEAAPSVAAPRTSPVVAPADPPAADAPSPSAAAPDPGPSPTADAGTEHAAGDTSEGPGPAATAVPTSGPGGPGEQHETRGHRGHDGSGSSHLLLRGHDLRGHDRSGPGMAHADQSRGHDGAEHPARAGDR